MKYFILAFLAIVLAGTLMSCTKKKPVPEDAIIKTMTFKVDGMTCGGCEYNVKKSLLKLEGVVDASADYKKGQATVKYIEGKVKDEQMVEAVNKSGYKATLKK